MSFTQALPFIMLGVLIALLPVGVIGLFASKISRNGGWPSCSFTAVSCFFLS